MTAIVTLSEIPEMEILRLPPAWNAEANILLRRRSCMPPKRADLNIAAVTGFQSRAGRGVLGTIDGRPRCPRQCEAYVKRCG